MRSAGVAGDMASVMHRCVTRIQQSSSAVTGAWTPLLLVLSCGTPSVFLVSLVQLQHTRHMCALFLNVFIEKAVHQLCVECSVLEHALHRWVMWVTPYIYTHCKYIYITSRWATLHTCG